MTAHRPWLGIKSANHRIKSDAPQPVIATWVGVGNARIRGRCDGRKRGRRFVVLVCRVLGSDAGQGVDPAVA